MHRRTASADEWDYLCRAQLLREIRGFLAGMPPVPDDGATDQPALPA